MNIPVDTGCKLNVLCTFNLRPVSTGMFDFPINKMQVFTSGISKSLLMQLH